MSDQDPADKLLNQGSEADRADYNGSVYGSNTEAKSEKGLQVVQAMDSAKEQAANWRGSK